MLTGVTIKRFKAIEDLALPLDRLNLLIGGNNSGKTSILQGIQFAVAVVQTLRSLGAPWQRNKVSYSFASSQLVYLPLRDVAPLRWRRLFYEGYAGIEVSFSARISEVSVTNPSQTTLLFDASTTVSVSKGRGQNIKVSVSGQPLGRKLESIDTLTCPPGLEG